MIKLYLFVEKLIILELVEVLVNIVLKCIIMSGIMDFLELCIDGCYQNLLLKMKCLGYLGFILIQFRSVVNISL